MLRCTAHVDLAGDGGGDQSGAAFLEQADGNFLFSDQSTKLRKQSLYIVHDGELLGHGWNGNDKFVDLVGADVRNTHTCRFR